MKSQQIAALAEQRRIANIELVRLMDVKYNAETTAEKREATKALKAQQQIVDDFTNKINELKKEMFQQ